MPSALWSSVLGSWRGNCAHLHVPRLRIGACLDLRSESMDYLTVHGPRPKLADGGVPNSGGLLGVCFFVLLSFAAIHEIATDGELSEDRDPSMEASRIFCTSDLSIATATDPVPES